MGEERTVPVDAHELLRAAGFDEATVTLTADGTVLPSYAPGPIEPSLHSLPLIAIADDGGFEPVPNAQLRMGTTLGQGGMGIVKSAIQVPLDREVAVKFLRASTDEPAARLALLREALITGQLAHPNIVPVYLLGRTEDDRPVLVMKRIAGISWRDVLDHPEAMPHLYAGFSTPLDFHLDVLKKVASAVHFAHSRGIVHRDVKPDNVMIGHFGEVYVLDWGIAVSLRDDHRLPRARDATVIAGTPAYMAPEMALANAEQIDERSDVYLLGAVLHELVVGKPPHTAETVLARVVKAILSDPFDYGPGVPEELAAICRKAKAADRNERHGSAEELRFAIVEYQRHESSRHLADEASRRLAELDGIDDDRERDRRLVECRFAYEQALKTWPENSTARAGLEQTLERLVTHELARENLAAARSALSQLADPPAALRAAVEALAVRLDERAARMRELEAREHDADLAFGTRGRSRLALSLGVAWGLGAIVCEVLQQVTSLRFGYPAAFAAVVFFGLQLLVGLWWVKRRFGENAAHRKLANAALIGAAVQLAYWLMAFGMRLPFKAAFPVYMFLVASGWTITCLTFDARALPMAIAFGTGALLMAFGPDFQLAIFGVVTLVGMIGLSRAWR